MPAPAAPPPESDEGRRARHLAMLREMAELGMAMARTAAAQAADPAPKETTPDPNLAFARATRAVRQAIALEARIAAGSPAALAIRLRYSQPDPGREKLRAVLHKLAPPAPGRAAFCRHVDERIDAEFRADPDLPLGLALVTICDHLGLTPDISKLPDELLVCERPGEKPASDSPAAETQQARTRWRPG